MPERFPEVSLPPFGVMTAWMRRRLPHECNGDSGPAEDWRTVILNAADRATGCFRGVAVRDKALVPFVILCSAGWWINVFTNGRLTYFDAWDGSERYTFWMNTSSVRDLVDRIDFEDWNDEHNKHDPR